MDTSVTGAKRRLHYGWVILGVSTLVVFGSLGLARFGYSLLLPSMQQGLGLQNAGSGALATANLVGYLVLSLTGGVLASHLGPRRVIAVGLVVAAVGMLLTGLARGFLDAALWRALTGIGSGASNVPVMGLLASWFSTRRRGLAAGVAVTGSSIALITASPAVPRVLAAYGDSGWRTCWFIFGGVTLAVAAGAWFLLRNHPSEMRLSPVGGGTGDSPRTRAEPLRLSSVYRSSAVWRLGLVYMCYGFAYIIYMTFFVKGLMTDGGYSQLRAGSLFMVMGWASLICGLLWGTISDMIGRRRALVIVYLIHTASFGLFALWQSPPGFTVSAVLFGISAWSIPAIMAASCGDVVGSRMAPAALGFITLFMGIGQAVAPSIAGAMADAAGTFRPALLLASGVALVGAAGAFTLRPVPSSAAETIS